MQIIEIVARISILFVVVGILFGLIDLWQMRKNAQIQKTRTKEKWKFAILIPARNESKVIKGLLDSLQMQTKKVNPKDVYIIVEEKEDPTYQIAKEYKMTPFLRTHKELQRKGYALDECIKDILEKKKSYDGYIIIDADNILKENFLEELQKSYEAGYEIATSYRNSKNGNLNVVATCSSLIFSLISSLGNNSRKKSGANVTLCGTGLLISGALIEKWKGFPFHELAEDYELSLYATLHQIPTDYNENAIVYDEQPTTLKQNIKQHTRWIKGFLGASKHYSKALLKQAKSHPKNEGSCYFYGYHILPILYIVIGLVLWICTFLLGTIVMGILQNSIWHTYAWILGITVLAIYLILLLLTIYLLHLEKGKLNLSKKRKWQSIFYNPIFLASFLPSFVEAICNPKVKWDPVEHQENKIV